MDLSLFIKAILDPHFNRSAWVKKIVKPGDIFNIKIVEVKNDQRALVNFGKFRALASVQFPVKAGTEMLAKVTDTKGQLRLQVLDPSAATAGGKQTVANRLEILSFDVFNEIRSDIKVAAQQILHPSSKGESLPPNIGRALATLDAYFASLDLSRNMTNLLPAIKSYVENSGIFFEQKVADLIRNFLQRSDAAELIRDPRIQHIMGGDLKPILMMLSKYLETPDSIAKFPDSKAHAHFKGTLDVLLADINHQQSRAVHKHDLPDPHQVFSFTLPLKENREKARLKLYCPKKRQGSSKAGFKISLLLVMGRIGEIRTDFFLLNKDLAITFFVKDNESKAQFERHYQEIREPLSSVFDYLVLKTVVSQKKIEEFHHVDLDFTTDRQVDLRI